MKAHDIEVITPVVFFISCESGIIFVSDSKNGKNAVIPASNPHADPIYFMKSLKSVFIIPSFLSFSEIKG